MSKRASKKTVKKSSDRTRGWCFTLNNWTKKQYKSILKLPVDYVIIGKETAPTTGTQHLQGYLYKKSKLRKNEVKKLIPGAHVESQRGTISQAIEYCMQDEDYEEVGIRPRQGKRTDLDIIKYDLKKGVPELEIANKYFSQWCQYRRAFREYKSMVTKKKTTIVIFDSMIPKSVKDSSKYMKGDYIILDLYQDLLFNYYTGKYDYIFVRKSEAVINLITSTDLENSEDRLSYVIV